MEQSEELSFLAMLDNRHKQMMDFLATYSDLAVVIDSILLTANALAVESTREHGSKSMTRTFVGLMWQTAADYHKQSVVHILSRELDAGFALVRMAIELARDAYVIGDDRSRCDLWLGREGRAKEYRKTFKFDKSNPPGKSAFYLYKLSSRYGVHGHMTSLMHAKTRGENAVNGKVAIINSDEKAILSGLRIWLRAFFPIHALFCDAFQLKKAPVSESFKAFIRLVNSLEPILDAVDEKAG